MTDFDRPSRSRIRQLRADRASSDRSERWGSRPEQGPRILFFSGGTALRDTSRYLRQFTHNSVHLVTPFDSGGSSAELRRCFAMPSIGDLRNRLLALADESRADDPGVYRLFSHRFSAESSLADLRIRFGALADGTDPLIASLPASFRDVACAQLRSFQNRLGGEREFDLRGASVGNLLLAARYLDNGRDLDAAVELFSEPLQVRGHVHLVSDVDLQLMSVLEDGSEIVGQHRFGLRSAGGPGRKIQSLHLVHGFDDMAPAVAPLTQKSREEIAAAQLICYPMGSLFSSVIAPLLVDGVASAIEESTCPKIFVPSMGVDPEQFGLSPSDAVDRLLQTLGHSLESPGNVLDFILLDSSDSSYALAPDRERLRRSGLEVIEMPLVRGTDAPRIEPERLVALLLSLI